MLTALGTVPFFLYVAVFLLLPIGVLAVEAFRATDPVTFEETWSTDSITDDHRGRLPAGLPRQPAAVADHRGPQRRPRSGAGRGDPAAPAGAGCCGGWCSPPSGVLANFGGIPLAFAFIATIGTQGVVTALLQDTLGIGLGGFSLYSMAGLALVYLYFLIPLMVLTIVPALEALRPQWREAADNLGASGWQYWRYVGGPVLAPPVIGATMLLFASAFAAYATAEALVGSSVPLVTLQIADALSSNVVVGSENLGKALALGMVVLVGAGHGRSTPGSSGARSGGWHDRAAPESVAGAGSVAPETPVRPGGAAAARRRWRFAVLGPLGVYFVVPIAASVWFTMRDRGTASSPRSPTPRSRAPTASPRRSPGRWPSPR